MRVLFDECVTHRLRPHLGPHECYSVAYAGFAGLKNGALLEAAENAGYEVLLTIDKGIVYQQNLSERTIGLILLRTKSSALPDLLPLVSQILQSLQTIEPGQVIRIKP